MESAPRLDRRLFGAAAILTVGLIVVLLVKIDRSLRSVIDSQREIGQSFDRMGAISKLRSVIEDAQTGERDFLITGNERYLEPYEAAPSLISQLRQNLTPLAAGERELGELHQQLEGQIDAELKDLGEAIAVRREQGADAALVALQAGEGKRHTDSMRDLASEMERLEADHRNELEKAVASRIHTSIALMFVKTIVGLSVVGIGYYLIQREMNARRQLAEVLQEADRKKNDFLALVGHELRNPLAALTNAADVLHLLGNLDETGEEMRTIINRQIVFMTRMVNDLLDTARVVHGKLELRKSRLDLAETLRRTVADSRSAMHGNGVRVDLEVPAEPVWVSGDATRLAQVVGNLIDNAVKFSPRSGQVWVELRTSEGNAQQAVISVVDRGSGMEPTVLQSVFEPFVQGVAAGDRDRRGLGLGLALSKGLVELHGGQITARSAGPGHGTTMTVTLPLDSTASDECEPCSVAAHHPGRCRVVVIDDRRDACYTLRRILELSGHEVHVATDGPQGIELVCVVRPDLVLCDIGLSGDMSGYDVVRKLRRLPETAHCYVVAVTGYGQDDVRQRASEAGFHRHVIKPVSIAVLNQIIAELPCATTQHEQTADSAGK